MCSWEATFFSTWGKSCSTGDKAKTEYREEIGRVPLTYAELQKKESGDMAGDPAKMKVLEQELEKMKASIAAEMQFGDEVYLLQFKANGRIYDYYAVCRPANCQVLPFDTLRSITRRWSEIKEW